MGDQACMCGHSVEEHGHDLKYPGSTACHGTGYGDEPCECVAYEADEEHQDNL